MLALGLLAWGACTTAYMAAEVVSITLDLHAEQKFHCAFNSNVYDKGSAVGKRNDISWDSGRAALDGVLTGTIAANESASDMSAIAVASETSSDNMNMTIDTTSDTDSFCSCNSGATRSARTASASNEKCTGDAMRSEPATTTDDCGERPTIAASREGIGRLAPVSAASHESIANDAPMSAANEPTSQRAVKPENQRANVEPMSDESRENIAKRAPVSAGAKADCIANIDSDDATRGARMASTDGSQISGGAMRRARTTSVNGPRINGGAADAYTSDMCVSQVKNNAYKEATLQFDEDTGTRYYIWY